MRKVLRWRFILYVCVCVCKITFDSLAKQKEAVPTSSLKHRAKPTQLSRLSETRSGVMRNKKCSSLISRRAHRSDRPVTFMLCCGLIRKRKSQLLRRSCFFYRRCWVAADSGKPLVLCQCLSKTHWALKQQTLQPIINSSISYTGVIVKKKSVWGLLQWHHLFSRITAYLNGIFYEWKPVS